MSKKKIGAVFMVLLSALYLCDLFSMERAYPQETARMGLKDSVQTWGDQLNKLKSKRFPKKYLNIKTKILNNGLFKLHDETFRLLQMGLRHNKIFNQHKALGDLYRPLNKISAKILEAKDLLYFGASLESRVRKTYENKEINGPISRGLKKIFGEKEKDAISKAIESIKQGCDSIVGTYSKILGRKKYAEYTMFEIKRDIAASFEKVCNELAKYPTHRRNLYRRAYDLLQGLLEYLAKAEKALTDKNKYKKWINVITPYWEKIERSDAKGLDGFLVEIKKLENSIKTEISTKRLLKSSGLVETKKAPPIKQQEPSIDEQLKALYIIPKTEPIKPKKKFIPKYEDPIKAKAKLMMKKQSEAIKRLREEINEIISDAFVYLYRVKDASPEKAKKILELKNKLNYIAKEQLKEDDLKALKVLKRSAVIARDQSMGIK